MPDNASGTSNLWILFALMTVASWGLYGIFLHMGQLGMGDPVHGRYKAFFMVGIAYMLIAVLAPGALLLAGGASWEFPRSGWMWSLVAGTVGAIGAFCVLLAFGAKGQPAVVMSIIFAGAPIVNAVVALSLHPPRGGWGSLPWQFFLGILMAAGGGTLVTLYKPAPGAAKPPGSATSVAPASPAAPGPGESA